MSFSGASLPDYNLITLAFNEANDPTGRTLVQPRIGSDRTCVLVTSGQSNSANHTFGHSYTIQNPTKVDNLNFFDRGIYRAQEPLLGCTADGDFDNFAPRLADSLINGGLYDRVIICPMGIGGMAEAEEAVGGVYNYRIGIMARQIAANGLVPTFVLIIRGETDGTIGTSTVDFTASRQSVIDTWRANGVTCPIFSSLTTYAKGVPGRDDVIQRIRDGQTAVVNPAANVFLGADTDTLQFPLYRQDEDGLYVHFNALGLTGHAALWYTVISNYLAGH